MIFRTHPQKIQLGTLTGTLKTKASFLAHTFMETLPHKFLVESLLKKLEENGSLDLGLFWGP